MGKLTAKISEVNNIVSYKDIREVATSIREADKQLSGIIMNLLAKAFLHERGDI